MLLNCLTFSHCPHNNYHYFAKRWHLSLHAPSSLFFFGYQGVWERLWMCLFCAWTVTLCISAIAPVCIYVTLFMCLIIMCERSLGLCFYRSIMSCCFKLALRRLVWIKQQRIILVGCFMCLLIPLLPAGNEQGRRLQIQCCVGSPDTHIFGDFFNALCIFTGELCSMHIKAEQATEDTQVLNSTRKLKLKADAHKQLRYLEVCLQWFIIPLDPFHTSSFSSAPHTFLLKYKYWLLSHHFHLLTLTSSYSLSVLSQR